MKLPMKGSKMKDYDLETVVSKVMDVRAEAFKLRPVNRGLAGVEPVDVPEIPKDESWKGEHLLRSIPKHNHSGHNMKSGVKEHERDAIRRKRRLLVGPLCTKGLTATQIAAEVGCSSHTIDNDLKALGLK